MLGFIICLVVGVAALLLAQKADIECVNAPRQPARRLANRKAAGTRKDRASRIPLAQLLHQ